jgi:HEAT repeat protein
MEDGSWELGVRSTESNSQNQQIEIDRARTAIGMGNLSIAIELLQHLSIDRLQDDRLVLELAFQILSQGDFQQQWEIAKIIPKLGEIAIPPLLDLLNDDDIDLEDRWMVARILGDFPQPPAIAALVELVSHNPDPELTAIATSALTKIGVPAIATLTNLIDTPDRQIAVTILAQIRHSQTIEPLIQVSNDPDPQIRTLSTEALGSFHDPRIPPILLAKLTDTTATVRQAAVTALCLRSDLANELNLSQHLRPLLFDLNLAVCQATALGLSRLPDPAATTVLTEVLLSTHTPTALRSSVILALGWIGTQAAIDSLIFALNPSLEISVDLVAEIIIAIGKTEREQIYASQILVNYLQTNRLLDSIVKQEIATALGNLGNSNIISDLVHLLTDPDDRVKLHTSTAIAKLSTTC